MSVEGSSIFRRYRSLSSVGRHLLPMAEEMHRRGMSWREIASALGVSPTVLYVWRKIGGREE